MKKIHQPVVNDFKILDKVAGRSPVADCPHISDDTHSVRARYDAYVAAHGNSFLPNCPQPVNMPGLLQNALRDRYGDKSDYLQPIEDLRTNSELNICPMCGLPGTGTLDHIFPQSIYPELAIFSRNLVPTCFRCNTKHQANYRGETVGERIFHPYFDDVLNTRLVRATIRANPTFQSPEVDLESCLAANDQLQRTVNYHIKTVLKPAGVVNDLVIFWADLRRFPRKELSNLPRVNFTNLDFDAAILDALDMADCWHTTPNNYKSMMFEALRITPEASAYLAEWVRDLDENPALAQDV